jgi:hypothetical protein
MKITLCSIKKKSAQLKKIFFRSPKAFYSMSKAPPSDYIRQKIKTLMKEMGIKKVKLGEVLGKGADEPRQQKYLRAERFLTGKTKDIKVDVLVRVADFFQKPLSYFLDFNQPQSWTLSTAEKEIKSDPKPLEEVRKNLERMGFDKTFIENQITQLKAMEKYRTGTQDSDL